MGVVYTLVIGKFTSIQEENTKLGLKNLKKYLMQYKPREKASLLCLDNCKNCFVTVDSKVAKKDIESFVDESVRVYRYDFNLGAMQRENEVFFNKEDVEENVCFSYSIDNKGVGDQVLIEYKNKVYDMSTYFSKTAVYESVQEAVQAKRNLAAEVLQ